MTTASAEFPNWLNASQILTIAIKNYLDACIALESIVALRFDIASRSIDSNQDTLLAAIIAEQAAVESRNTDLKRANASINRIYDNSKKLVPIRLLPDDVMVYIFAHTFHDCKFLPAGRISFPAGQEFPDHHRCFQPLLTIAKVCSHWRRIALGTASFWNHVDMVDRGGLSKRSGTTELWLERASGTPLSIRIFIEETVRENYNEGALKRLLPHIGLISSLALQHMSDDSSIHGALRYWWANGTPGSVKQLSLYGPHYIRTQATFKYLDDTQIAMQDIVESFLRPLRVLRLRNVAFRWSSAAYHNLYHLDLSLVPSEAGLTPYQMGSVLSASPKLRYLRLDMVSIQADPQDDYYQSTPHTELDELQTLDVGGLSTDPFSTLFPLMSANLAELALKLDATKLGREHFVPSLVPSNITRLHLQVFKHQTGIIEQLLSLPLTHLRVLIFEFKSLSAEEACRSIIEDMLWVSDSVQFPSLNTLWIIRGIIWFNSIEPIVAAYNIQTLVLTNTQIFGSGAVASLKHSVPRLIIEDDGQAGTVMSTQWDFRIF